MDIRNLQTLLCAAETGSFTRAAEVLGYAQPTVSFQIRQLESELGVRLFDRIGHTVSLTESGREAIAYAKRILNLSSEMAANVTGETALTGTVRLAMAASLCTPLIATRFAEFHRQHPTISLHVTTGGVDELFRSLDHNEADIVATLDTKIYDASYVIAHEKRVGVHFVAPAGHPLAAGGTVSVEALLAYPLLLTEKGMSYRRHFDELLARHALFVTPLLENGNAELLCRLCEEGMGLSLLPDYVTAEAVAAGRLARISVKDLEVELWWQLLTHRDKWISAPIRAVLAHLSALEI